MKPHPFDHLATQLRTNKRPPRSERGLVRLILPHLTPEQLERYSRPVYYYESREGPYDWLIDDAIEHKVILWDSSNFTWKLGILGHLYGRSIYQRRQHAASSS